jgi:MFS family permease
MLQANSVALAVTSVRRSQMRAALGIQAAAQSLGLAMGPTVGGWMVGSAGWRWVFWINVPVGLTALVAGRYLLPRTREHIRGGPFDGAGLAALAVATTSLLVAVSAASGLGLPPWAIAVLLATALTCALGFGLWERRVASPLIDPVVIRSAAAGLTGALCGYLVLFGPLVLLPQMLLARGLDELYAGLVLSALPVGFALAALGGDHMLPRWWGNRPRCVAGALTAAGACALLAIAPATPFLLGCFLALLGLGLGMFVPANNSVVMAAVPARLSATAGGMISMARGIGTALGIATVTLTLHLTGGPGITGARAALAALAAVALAAALTAVFARIGHVPESG